MKNDNGDDYMMRIMDIEIQSISSDHIYNKENILCLSGPCVFRNIRR